MIKVESPYYERVRFPEDLREIYQNPGGVRGDDFLGLLTMENDIRSAHIYVRGNYDIYVRVRHIYTQSKAVIFSEKELV